MPKQRRKKCPAKCPCLCHDMEGNDWEHPGQPCYGKSKEPRADVFDYKGQPYHRVISQEEWDEPDGWMESRFF